LFVGMAMIAPRHELLRAYLPRILVVYGPALAALLLARYADAGGVAVRLRRLLPSRNDVWVTAAVFLASGVAVAIALRAVGVGPAEMSRVVRAHAGLFAAHFALQVAIVAVGEELGWRGWLLPQLAARTSRLRAALGTGVIWGVWHAPLLLSGMATASMFLLFVVGLSLLFTWLWAQARSGLFTVVVAHASVNAPLFFWEQVSAGTPGSDDRLRRAWLVLQVMCTTAALVLVLARWRWWSGTAATERAEARRAA
ncbi:MAG TPA: CPBP family intramembrane glutamic endopeptidase, partial [Gemmatimonadaceae bacterium]